jgi:hypothetical protein
MKKILFAVLFVASLGVINAQQLPNSDFETWSGANPTSWNDLNYSGLSFGTNSLTKSTDAHSGSSAMKVAVSPINPTIKILLQMSGALPDSLSYILDAPIPGMATNGTVDLVSLLPVIGGLLEGEFDISMITELGKAITDGLTLTQKPVKIAVYAKATIENETDMMATLALVYSGTGEDRQVIGFGVGSIGASTTYEEIVADIMYTDPTATPSELIVLFAAISATQTAVAPYSYMIVDDLIIDYSSGISNVKLSDVSIYPNPAKEVLNIKTSATKYEIEVVDVLGRVVITENSKPTINISDLTKGVYFVKVTQNGTTNTEKIVVE